MATSDSSSNLPPESGPNVGPDSPSPAGAPAKHASGPQRLPLPPRFFIPLPQHTNRDNCKPIGTCITRGESLVVSTSGTETIPLASAAGVIHRVVQVETIGGGRCDAIEIEVDASQDIPSAEQASTESPTPPPVNMAELIDRLRLHGIGIDRRTSPNLLGQLEEAVRRPIDTVLCNLLDEAGESTLNSTLLRSAGADMMQGIAALGKVTTANRIWIAVDPRLATRVAAVVRKSGNAARMKVVSVPNNYPQADPTLLIYALLGRKLRPGRLPPQVNVMLLDGACATAVGACISRDAAMLETFLEVRHARQSRCTMQTVAIGTPLRFVLDALKLDPAKLTLRAGAALRDVRVSADAIIDGRGDLSIDAGPMSALINPDPCIRCGWCVEACPVRIHPAGLLEAAQDNDTPAAERYGISSCIECGICSYVCPSRLPLLGAIRDLRVKMNASTTHERDMIG